MTVKTENARHDYRTIGHETTQAPATGYWVLST